MKRLIHRQQVREEGSVRIYQTIDPADIDSPVSSGLDRIGRIIKLRLRIRRDAGCGVGLGTVAPYCGRREGGAAEFAV